MEKIKAFMFTIIAITLQLTTSTAIWSCSTESDCSFLEGGVCTNNECICPAGFQIVDNGRRCAPVAPYHFSTCLEDFQCSRLFNGFQCYSENGSEGTCRCRPGHHYFHGRCWETKDYGAQCTWDDECQSPILRNPFAFQCLDGVCTCSEGFFLRQRGECRRIGHAIGDGCVLDVDCHFPNGVCDFWSRTCYDSTEGLPTRNITKGIEPKRQVTDAKMASRQHGVACSGVDGCNAPFVCSAGLGVCVCPIGYYNSPNGDECWAEIGSPATAATCQGLFNILENGNCVCPPNFFAEESMRDCVKATLRFSDSCISDPMCHTFGAASVCSDPIPPWNLRSCQCIPELSIKEEHNSMCRLFSGIGEYCVEDSDCMAGAVEILCRPDEEDVKRCTCPDGMMAVGNLCLADGLEIGDSCQVSEECTGTENAVCEDGICSCDVGYQQSGNYCVSVIGGDCSSHSDCTINNTSCQETDNGVMTCQCMDSFVEYQDECWPVSPGFNATCDWSKQCTPNLGDGSICDEGFCSCAESFHHRDYYCWPKTGLFEPCIRASQCFLGNITDRVVCRNSLCQCDFNYPFSEELNTCGSASRTLGSLLIVLAAIIKIII